MSITKPENLKFTCPLCKLDSFQSDEEVTEHLRADCPKAPDGAELVRV